MENVFLALYTVEMVLKIVGLGFIFGEDAYLKDSWNLLDFSIVMISYFTLFSTEDATKTAASLYGLQNIEGTEGFSFTSLRVFRVLRPLKTISSIKGLKVLMTALFSAIPLLKDTLVILLFFFIIFAIGGTQLLTGVLKQKCIAIQTGQPHPDDLLCGAQICPGGYFCGKSNENPNFGVTNFDNLFYSLLCVFQCVTLEGWSEI